MLDKVEDIKVRMNIRDMDAEFELEVMAEPDEDGELCILVVECEPISEKS